MNAVAQTFRPSGPLPADPLAAYSGPWNSRWAAHLARRAGFGGSPSDVARLAAMPMDGAVDWFVKFAPPSNLPSQPEVVSDDEVQSAIAMMPAPQESPAPGLDPAILQRRQVARVYRRRQDMKNVTWWLSRMVATTAPLQEKMTLFWHGHYATAANTKGIYGLEIVDQNNLLRRFALGNAKNLTHEIGKDVAMLRWLDNAGSRKEHPNENYARELMELFTLGIGNYTEADVRESARAFTGFTFARRTGRFYFNEAWHDDGQKTFLGETGNFNGDDIVEIIYKQPAASRFLATKLLEFFVYDDPEPELVDATAALIRKNQFEMAPVMSTLFRSRVFFSDRAYRALVKSPVEFVIGTYQLFGVTTIKPDVIGVLGRMGQVPFHPPSVKGWDGGAQWLNTQTVLARENFVSQLMTSPDMSGYKGWLTDSLPPSANAASAKLIGTILQNDASAAASARVTAYLDGSDESAAATMQFSGENFEQRMRGAAYLTMAMPAYQLS
jgi:uncharacterized protein (DUF1800 family)